MPDLSDLKVCFIAGTLGQGGAERQLFCILDVLRQNGAQPRLLSLTQGEFWEERIRELGVPITWVGQSGSKLARLRRIITETRRHRPDVLQSQHFFTNLYTVAAARMLNIPEIGAIRSDGINDVRSNGRVLGSMSLRMPKLIAVNSRTALRNAISLGVPPGRLQFLPNVVDTEHFNPLLRTESNKVRLVTVGRLVAPKRVDRFLSVLARVKRETAVALTATIVGDGTDRKELERQAVDLGLGPETLRFAGTVADVASAYNDADIFVLTSDHEGTPNALLEAMASGLPVVATRVGGVPELVRNGETGYLADPQNESEMVRGLISLIQDRGLRIALGHNAREYVAQNHSTIGLTDGLKAIYSVALSGNHRKYGFQTRSQIEEKGTA
jgi:glycosyltransferase involved in cell wall biosynthesis